MNKNSSSTDKKINSVFHSHETFPREEKTLSSNTPSALLPVKDGIKIWRKCT